MPSGNNFQAPFMPMPRSFIGHPASARHRMSLIWSQRLPVSIETAERVRAWHPYPAPWTTEAAEYIIGAVSGFRVPMRYVKETVLGPDAEDLVGTGGVWPELREDIDWQLP